MKRWNKTTMVWGCHLGIETDVPVTDWHKSEEKYMHKIHEITATALPDRVGEIALRILRVSIAPTTERQTIVNRISMELTHKARVRSCTDEYSSVFIIAFSLENGEQFCETAIELVSKIFKALGVEDDTGYYLADFSLTQETLIQLDGAWIKFAQWLRIMRRLPILG